MPSYLKLAAQALGITGDRGSWARRIAENATVIDGVTLGALGTKGSWGGRLAAAMGRTTGRGSWFNRIAPGGPSSEGAFAALCNTGPAQPAVGINVGGKWSNRQDFAAYGWASARKAVKISGAQTAIRIAFPNFGIYDGSVGGAAQGNGGALTVLSAYVEYPAGTFTQVLFDGAASGTADAVNNGAADAANGVLISDPVSVAIPDLETIWVWWDCHNPNGVWLRGSNDGGSDAAGDGVSIHQTATPGYAASHTPLASWNKNIGAGAYMPLAAIIGAPKAGAPAVMNFGDSISNGIATDNSTYGGNLAAPCGIVGRGMPTDAVFCNLGQASQKAQDAVNQAPWKALYPYFDVFINQFGTNDKAGGASDATLAGYQTALANDIVAHGAPTGAQFWLCTLTPRPSSTDGFTTVANQTASAWSGYNALVRAGVTGWDHVLDLSDYVSTGRETGKWQVPNAHPRTVTTFSASGAGITLSGADTFFASDAEWASIPVGGTNQTILSYTDATHATTVGNNITVTGVTAYLGGATVDGLHPVTGMNKYAGAQFPLATMGF